MINKYCLFNYLAIFKIKQIRIFSQISIKSIKIPIIKENRYLFVCFFCFCFSKKVVIHVPVHVKKHKHTHTIYKIIKHGGKHH